MHSMLMIQKLPIKIKNIKFIYQYKQNVYKHNKNDINPEKISYKENESYNDKKKQWTENGIWI